MKASGNLLLQPRSLIVGALVVGLAGLAALAMNLPAERGASTPATLTRAAQPPRPAFSAAEEQYIRSLWPIHGDVERTTMRLSLGQIFYKTQDLDRAELRARVEQAVATYQDAEARLRSLEPPASLRSEHDEYLAAVTLFKESAAEVRKMFTHGSDDYMLAAYPKSQEGSNKIREVGGKLWPHEFPPH